MNQVDVVISRINTVSAVGASNQTQVGVQQKDNTYWGLLGLRRRRATPDFIGSQSGRQSVGGVSDGASYNYRVRTLPKAVSPEPE